MFFHFNPINSSELIPFSAQPTKITERQFGYFYCCCLEQRNDLCWVLILFCVNIENTYKQIMGVPLTELHKLYGLQLSVVRKVEAGFLSENYILTDGTAKFFLKKHRHVDNERVEQVCFAEKFFSEGGVSVILPILSIQEKPFFDYKNRFYSLYPYVSGLHQARGRLTEKAAISLAQTLAILHKRGSECTVPLTGQFKVWNTSTFLSKTVAIETEIKKEQPLSQFGSMVLESLRVKKDAVIARSISHEQLDLPDDHLIHGDYFCDNVFFGESGTVSFVFDFEKTQYAPPLYELFRSMIVSFFSIPNKANLRLAKKYVSTYLTSYPFTEEIIKKSFEAAYQKQIHSLWIEEGHYLTNSTRADLLLPSQLACNKYYIENRVAIEKYVLG